MRGTSARTPPEFIGHSDVRTTYNRDGKLVPEDLAPGAAQLEEYFDRGPRAARIPRREWGQRWGQFWGQRDRFQAAPTGPQRVK